MNSVAAENFPQARALYKAEHLLANFRYQRQQAGMIPLFQFAPARRMGEAGKHQRFLEGNF